jgi:predicted lysophospholipase L1 biosynthesis ABC-type transport system permease subunit
MKEKQTNNIKTILKFSFRILFRQWRRFVLPFLSIFFTSLIIFSVLIFTNSSSDFLLSKNKELIGGDISIESSSKIEKEKLENIFGDGVDIL